jgi:mRNA-degrading endonuclease RelE of RelBE toxin-antitoxin system
VVLEAIGVQLRHKPALVTRNRKPLRPNPIGSWELRVGDLRVYYDVAETPDPVVLVLAIGIKSRDAVRIGGQVRLL